MNMNLTADQVRAIDNGEPVRLVVDGQTFVLLPSTTYDQLRTHADEWHPDTMLQNLASIMADDWNDLEMSIYDEP